ncbi:MAG: hypothetical protein ACFFAU_09115 [Candidatus Hodarchaeota archaeon]
MHTWTPSYFQFQEVFSNDYCLKILLLIFEKTKKRETLCATDVAKILDMHVSTATKYLDLLCKYEFVSKKQFHNKPGKPTYYASKSELIAISLDLSQLTNEIQDNLDINTIQNPLIREKPNIQERVSYEFNNDGSITNFIIKKKTKARRVVNQKIDLSRNESAFMKYLPHPTMEAECFLDICAKANLSDFYAIKGIISFLEKLKKYDIIEIEDQY